MNGNKYKILIIEDDEHINNLVATLLEANGYQTLSAYSCEDGMMMYASHRPDLVVLDLGLPSGRNDFFKAVTERFPDAGDCAFCQVR